MSHKFYVREILEELKTIQDLGFSYLSKYKNAEALVGDEMSVDLIQFYFSREGRHIIDDIISRGETVSHAFVNKLIYDVTPPNWKKDNISDIIKKTYAIL